MSDAIRFVTKGPSGVHANARLTVHGRVLLVQRVRRDHRPVAHVARELGISRQCGSLWVNRSDREGRAGLLARSSRPHHQPRRTSNEREAQVLAACRAHADLLDLLDLPIRMASPTTARS